MPEHWEYTEHNLLPDEAAIVTRYAKGHALEFGSGWGLGTYALLAGRSTHILSIDEDVDFTEECSARYTDPRVEWLCLPVNEHGWYDHDNIKVPEIPYDTVVLDGPSKYPGRRHCLPMLLHPNDPSHPDRTYLAEGWQLLVTRTSKLAVQHFIERWLQKFSIKREHLFCERGIIRITAV